MLVWMRCRYGFSIKSKNPLKGGSVVVVGQIRSVVLVSPLALAKLRHWRGFVHGPKPLAFIAPLPVALASGDASGASDVMPLVCGVRLMPIDRVRGGVVCRFRLILIFSKMRGRVRYETYETVTLFSCQGFRRFCSVGGWPIFIFCGLQKVKVSAHHLPPINAGCTSYRTDGRPPLAVGVVASFLSHP